jgi:hypothetical protein
MSAYRFRPGRLQQTAFGSATPPAAPASPFPYIVPDLVFASTRAPGASGLVDYPNAELLQEGDIILVMCAADAGNMSEANTAGWTKVLGGDGSVATRVFYQVVGPTPPTQVIQFTGAVSGQNLAITIRDSRGIRGTFEDYTFVSVSSLAAAVATPVEANELVITYVAIDDRSTAPGVFPNAIDNYFSGAPGGTVAMASQVSAGAGPVSWTSAWGSFGFEPIIRAAFSFSPIV